VELFVVGRRVSGLADDKAVSRRLDDFDRDNLGVVDAQGAFNLGEQPCEKSVVFPLPVEIEECRCSFIPLPI
jgi:hypothetical protein